MATKKAWNKAANNLGYKDEITMLRDLYIKHQMPINRIAILLGSSYNTIRYRLKCNGVKFTSLPRRYRGTLDSIDDEQLFADSAIRVAKALEVHRSTVHRERLRRRPGEDAA